MMRFAVFVAAAACMLQTAERKVDSTFLRRQIAAVEPQTADVSAPGCVYRPVFGEGDPDARIARGVARFGEITVAPGSACQDVTYPAEEQVYVVMEGAGTLRYAGDEAPVRAKDFAYLPAGVRHGIANRSAAPVRLFVFGFRVPAGTPPPPKLLMANIDEIRKQTVSGHPDSVVYQLMMGDTTSTRDRIAAGHRLTSLYVMEFQPGGTNFPHHHDSEEEIYILLDGRGEMVAGGGAGGIEGRHASAPGDAWFFRLNCTVGFYNGKEGVSHILAVRSRYPRRGE